MTRLASDNAVTLKVFEVVAAARALAFREILEILGTDRTDRSEAKADLREILGRLVEEDLLAHQDASVEDFDIYHITSRGLLAYRQLKHSGLLNEDEPLSRLIS